MTIYAITNQKGGSGKTTTAVNLAASLAERGRRVLVVDLDPQASASKWFGITEDGAELLAALIAETPSPVRETLVEGVHLIPSGPRLVRAEGALVSDPNGAGALARMLESFSADSWDAILLDCPPSPGIIPLGALRAADAVLVPVETSTMAVDGLAAILETVRRADVTLAGVLLCRVDGRRRLSGEIVVNVRNRLGEGVLRTTIRENVSLVEAWGHRKPITEYDPGSTGAADYRALAKELEERS